MAELKTKENDASVEGFLNAVENEKRRSDSFKLLKMFQEITGEPAKMWGPSIVGFGSYHYKYETGREGDMARAGFSPRKQSLTLYIMPGFEHFEELMGKLGKYKTGKSCLYINKLEDVDLKVLRKLVEKDWKHMNKLYPENAKNS